jgi:CRISPR-associated endoribonuclease Cas6
MSICQLTFRLFAENGVRFQSFSGFAVRGLFFDLLKRVDEQLALELHSKKSLAPYSVTPLEVLYEQFSHFIYNRFDKPVPTQFKISLFEPGLRDVITKSMFSSGSPSVRLVDVEATVTEVSVIQESFQKIFEEAKPVKRFEVVFRTPSYFRKSVSAAPSNSALKGVRPPYRSIPLPDVGLMLRNLTRLWRRFSGMSFEYRDYAAWVDMGGIAIAGFPRGIRTVRVYEHPESNKWVMGFVGSVRFSTPSDLFSERFARFTDALMRFAEYSNIGGGRTAGFGVVSYFPKDY